MGRRSTNPPPRCAATNQAGSPCGQYAVAGYERCLWHEPALAERAREVRSRGHRTMALGVRDHIRAWTSKHAGDVMKPYVDALSADRTMFDSVTREVVSQGPDHRVRMMAAGQLIEHTEGKLSSTHEIIGGLSLQHILAAPQDATDSLGLQSGAPEIPKPGPQDVIEGRLVE